MDGIKPTLATEISGGQMVSTEEISGSAAEPSAAKRVHLPEGDKLDLEQFSLLWQEQNRYVDQLELKVGIKARRQFSKIYWSLSFRRNICN